MASGGKGNIELFYFLVFSIIFVSSTFFLNNLLLHIRAHCLIPSCMGPNYQCMYGMIHLKK